MSKITDLKDYKLTEGLAKNISNFSDMLASFDRPALDDLRKDQNYSVHYPLLVDIAELAALRYMIGLLIIHLGKNKTELGTWGLFEKIEDHFLFVESRSELLGRDTSKEIELLLSVIQEDTEIKKNLYEECELYPLLLTVIEIDSLNSHLKHEYGILGGVIMREKVSKFYEKVTRMEDIFYQDISLNYRDYYETEAICFDGAADKEAFEKNFNPEANQIIDFTVK